MGQQANSLGLGFWQGHERRIKSFLVLMWEGRGVVRVQDRFLVAAMAPPGGGRQTDLLSFF